MVDNLAHPYNRRRVLTIDDLPDDVLLVIFGFCVVRYLDPACPVFAGAYKKRTKTWQSLVHVCRRWRGLVFGSPRHLNLQLYCDSGREALDVWPDFPLCILGAAGGAIYGLKHSDRICQVNLDFQTSSQIENLQTAMQVPFPELAILCLSADGVYDRPVLPDSFLGGSAPRLRCISLNSIPFPGLPKLLLSATHLVNLYLSDIPHSGYISPEAMVTCLSILTSLETLQLEFEYPQSYPVFKSRRPFPPTRSVLPSLMNFWFKGVTEYLEEFTARVDAPQLYQLLITFFNDIDFNTPELIQFISRTPILGAYHEVRLVFYKNDVLVSLCRPHSQPSDHRRMVDVNILSQVSDRQLSTLVKFCNLSRPILTMENLFINGSSYSPLIWEDDIDNTRWLDLLRPFAAVKNLYLDKLFSPHIALALQELTREQATEVLPALQNVLLKGFRPLEPVEELEGIARFISARQFTNHPVTISVWD